MNLLKLIGADVEEALEFFRTVGAGWDAPDREAAIAKVRETLSADIAALSAPVKALWATAMQAAEAAAVDKFDQGADAGSVTDTAYKTALGVVEGGGQTISTELLQISTASMVGTVLKNQGAPPQASVAVTETGYQGAPPPSGPVVHVEAQTVSSGDVGDVSAVLGPQVAKK